MATRPCIRQLVLERRQSKVAYNKGKAEIDVLQMGSLYVPNSSNNGTQSSENRPRVLPVWPKALQFILVQKHACKIGLRVEIDSKNRLTAVSDHGGQVIDESGFPHAALIVEEGNGFQTRLQIVARTYP
jgi:hypothetical protein